MKRTVYESTEALDDGTLLVKLRKEIVEDGVVIWSQPHRAVIHPGDDADAILAGVAAHLAAGVSPDAKSPPIKFAMGGEVTPRVKALAAVEHTPERVAKFKADKKDREDREAAIRNARKIN